MGNLSDQIAKYPQNLYKEKVTTFKMKKYNMMTKQNLTVVMILNWLNLKIKKFNKNNVAQEIEITSNSHKSKVFLLETRTKLDDISVHKM